MVPFAGLLAALEQIPDPRRRQGQRYSLAPLLLFAVLAVLAGATSYYCCVTGHTKSLIQLPFLSRTSARIVERGQRVSPARDTAVLAVLALCAFSLGLAAPAVAAQIVPLTPQPRATAGRGGPEEAQEAGGAERDDRMPAGYSAGLAGRAWP